MLLHPVIDLAKRVRKKVEKSKWHLDRLDSRAQKPLRRVMPAARHSTGGTPLHAAVAACEIRKAAELLMQEIDVSATDDAGHTALSPEFAPPEVVHAIRQQYQLTREFDFGSDGEDDCPELEEVRERGIAKLPGFIAPQLLSQLQRAISSPRSSTNA